MQTARKSDAMRSRNINVELLISLVKKRPVIWDKSVSDYKQKKIRTAAWREICIILNNDFSKMEEKKREYYAKDVVNKWNNLRDCWMRSFNEKRNMSKSGSSRYVRHYIYHNQMLFLEKNCRPAFTHESAMDHDISMFTENVSENQYNSAEESQQEITNQDISITETSACADSANEKPKNNSEIRSKKVKRHITLMQKFNELNRKVKLIDHQMKNKSDTQVEDRNLLFFKSLLPSLATMKDDQLLEFQAGVINLVQIIKNRNDGSHASTYDFYQSPSEIQSQNDRFRTRASLSTSSVQSIKSNASDVLDFKNI